MKTRLLVVALLLVSLHASRAAAVAAIWATKDTTAKTITGSLGPASISITNISAPSITTMGNDFSGSNYSAAPLSNSEGAISNYEVGSNYTVTFSVPVSGLMIYGMNWRGSAMTPFTYSFNHPLAILSAFDGASASGNTLTISTSFDDGIIRFSEPVKTLTVTMNTNSTGGQIMTFGVVPRATSVAVTGSAKPKTKRKTYTLRGTADATYGIQAVKVKVGHNKSFSTAKGTSKWTFKVKLAPGTTKVQIEAVSNTGETSPITRVSIKRK